MVQKYTELIGKEVAIKCRRHPEGKIVKIERDRWGAFFKEDWQKCHLVDEHNLEVYFITPVKGKE